eukprot:COSAG02_NODE_3728_length_6315_cov_3.649614_3_plen_107_part_00
MGAITDCAAVRTLRPKGNALNRVITLNKQSGGPAFGALFASASRIPKRPRTRSLQEPHKTASSSRCYVISIAQTLRSYGFPKRVADCDDEMRLIMRMVRGAPCAAR